MSCWVSGCSCLSAAASARGSVSVDECRASWAHRWATWQVHAASHGACTPSLVWGSASAQTPHTRCSLCRPPEDVGGLSLARACDSLKPSDRRSASAGAAPAASLLLPSLCSPVRALEGAGCAPSLLRHGAGGLAPKPGLRDRKAPCLAGRGPPSCPAGAWDALRPLLCGL